MYAIHIHTNKHEYISQRRLNAVETERDQLRAERDHFKAIVSKYPFATGLGFTATLAQASPPQQQQQQQQ
jgi:hypothetical protein